MVETVLHFSKITLPALSWGYTVETRISVRRLLQSSRENTMVAWKREVAMEVARSGKILDKY